MEKSIIVAKAELKQVCLENINRSGLPLFVVCGMLDEINRELKPLAKKQEEEEVQKWNEFVDSQKKNISEGEECQTT